MIVVLDSSAAAELVLKRERANTISQKIVSADTVIAPNLFISEIATVLWKYYRFSELPLEACEDALENAIALPDEYVDEIEFYREAFAMACLTQKSIYDMIYLVLARRNNGFLATMDKTLIEAAQKHSIKVL